MLSSFSSRLFLVYKSCAELADFTGHILRMWSIELADALSPSLTHIQRHTLALNINMETDVTVSVSVWIENGYNGLTCLEWRSLISSSWVRRYCLHQCRRLSKGQTAFCSLFWMKYILKINDIIRELCTPQHCFEVLDASGSGMRLTKETCWTKRQQWKSSTPPEALNTLPTTASSRVFCPHSSCWCCSW